MSTVESGPYIPEPPSFMTEMLLAYTEKEIGLERALMGISSRNNALDLLKVQDELRNQGNTTVLIARDIRDVRGGVSILPHSGSSPYDFYLEFVETAEIARRIFEIIGVTPEINRNRLMRTGILVQPIKPGGQGLLNRVNAGSS